MSFCWLQFPPKNEQKQVDLRFQSSKVVFVCLFFGGNIYLKKSFRLFLTFSSHLKTAVNIYKWWPILAIGLLRLRGGIDLVKMANQDDFFSTNTLQISPREKKISECSESLDSGLDDNEKVESDPSPPVRNVALQVCYI